MALMANIQSFTGALGDLRTLCASMKKYEAAFSPEARQLFQGVTSITDQALKELEHLPPTDVSIAGYLARGTRTLALRAVLQQVQQAVSGFTSGAVPVPRSSKEELSRVHGLILSLRFSLSSEEHLVISQLRKLCAEVQSQRQDFDVIETNLDNTMRNVLQQVHGQAVLEPEVLDSELKQLQSGIVDARNAGASQLEDILSLALNSLQRLHANHAESEDDEDDGVSSAVAFGAEGDVEEDDDDDPFFMPMPNAIKWAEASKFKELAKPLTPEQPADKQFMIVMEDDDVNQMPSSIGTLSVEPSLHQLVGVNSTGAAQQPAAGDSAQSSPVPAPASASTDTAPAFDTASAADTTPAAPVVTSKATIAEKPDVTAPKTPPEVAADGPAVSEGPVASPAPVRTEEPAAARQAPATPPGASPAPAQPAVCSASPAPAPSPREGEPAAPQQPTEEKAIVSAPKREGAAPPPEKLTDFVNFLNGENPGACMFHAQMRLSPEGCMKLANFLRSSARVRALSLSHNYLGDEGLKLICVGLRENKSVTALDLPDNNISDVGAALLADAIKDNPSLTQLQLAYNKISDQGAMALAQVIRHSHSLKKLGLAFNQIGKAGCQALTAAISANQSLKHMQLLPGNPVEEKDAKALAKALKRNNKFSIKQLLGLKADS